MTLCLCCKNSRRTFLGVQSHLLFSLGRNAKQAGDEGHLPSDISFVHPVHLSLANHMHRFLALKRSPCRFHGNEAHGGLDESFEKAVVLLDQGIQVVDLPQFYRFGKDSGNFEESLGRGLGRIFIDVDHTRSQLRGVGISRSRGLGSLRLGRMRPRSRTSNGAQRLDARSVWQPRPRASDSRETEGVFPKASTARSRYIQTFFTLRYVSSTLQESVVALRCGRQRLSSSGA